MASLVAATTLPTTFTYEPLNRLSIRLLTLQRGTGDEPIQCSLRNIALKNVEHYEALSYEWGLSIATATEPIISLNGFPVQVRRNLEVALLHVRQIDQDRELWVDALCINQADTKERNSQVRLMCHVYTRSTRVVAWIGLGDEASDCAMDLLNRTLVLLAKWQSRQYTPLLLHDHLSVSIKEIKALHAWAERSYWYRLWILQEIIMTGDLCIYCGEKVVQGQNEQLWVVAGELGGEAVAMARTRAFGILKSRSTRVTPLGDRILEFSKAVCSEPRDIVFGLLGLASDTSDGRYSNLDYAMTFAEFYEEVLTTVIVGYDYNGDNKNKMEMLRRCLRARFGISGRVTREIDRGLDSLFESRSHPMAAIDKLEYRIGALKKYREIRETI